MIKMFNWLHISMITVIIFIKRKWISSATLSNGCPSLMENNECIISDADIKRNVSEDGRQVRGELSLYKHMFSWCELGPVSLLVIEWKRKEIGKIQRKGRESYLLYFLEIYRYELYRIFPILNWNTFFNRYVRVPLISKGLYLLFIAFCRSYIYIYRVTSFFVWIETLYLFFSFLLYKNKIIK